MVSIVAIVAIVSIVSIVAIDSFSQYSFLFIYSAPKLQKVRDFDKRFPKISQFEEN